MVTIVRVMMMITLNAKNQSVLRAKAWSRPMAEQGDAHS